MQEFSRVYESGEEAEAARNQLLSFAGNDGLGLENLYSVGEIAPMENGGYGFTVSYCGDALLRSYAMILAYGESVYQAEGVLFSEDETGLALATLLYENAAGITGGHLLLNSYVIAGEAK